MNTLLKLTISALKSGGNHRLTSVSDTLGRRKEKSKLRFLDDDEITDRELNMTTTTAATSEDDGFGEMR